MQNNFILLESKPAAQFFSHAVPSIVGLLLTSGIIIIDGLFIGNSIGKSGLASVNLTLPVLYLFLGVTIMIGVGGSVKTGHALGKGDLTQAQQHFTSTIALAIIFIVALTLSSFLVFDPLLEMINTNPLLHPFVECYLRTILWFYPPMMINIIFSIFLRTQGKPVLSLFFGVAGNAMNIVLDYLMIVRWGMGLHGAALATGISVMIPLWCGIYYYLSGQSILKFAVFSWKWRDVGQTIFNGSSEMIGQLSIGFTTWVFNMVILSRMGVDGVAAYTIVGYTAFVQIMIITGFATGVGPIVGYSFGAGKTDHIRQIMRIALFSCFVTGAVCWGTVLLSSASIANSFSPGNGNIVAIAESSFGLFSVAFLLNGFNILITAYFTAIGNAGVSAILATLRGILLINLFVLILPRFMGDAGIWISYPLTELVTLVFAVLFMKNSYHSMGLKYNSKRCEL